MTIRHTLDKGTKLTADEAARLQERLNAQRHTAESLMTRLREMRDASVDFRADTRTLMMVPTKFGPAEWQAALGPVSERERNHERQPRAVLASKQQPSKWIEAIGGPVALNSHAHGQLCDRLRETTGKTLARDYWWWMLDNDPELFAGTVNTLLARHADTALVRTVNGYARAVLSSKYRVLDNYDLAGAVLPIMTAERSPWLVKQCGLTDLRMHLEAYIPTQIAEIRVGDPVALAIKIQGSDVGCSALSVSFGIERLICANLAIVPDYSQRWIHLGSRDEHAMVELLTERTLRMEERLVFAKVRDVVQSMARPEMFQRVVETIRGSAVTKLDNPIAATEVLRRSAGLTEPETKAVQNNLLQSGDATVWGLMNALTASVHRADYERKAELERVAGSTLNDPKAWRQFVEAREAA